MPSSEFGLGTDVKLLQFVSFEIEAMSESGFRQFDLATDYSDHYFANNKAVPASCFENVRSSVYKRIMRDWRILRESLPESIYVRAYEERIDILRAVIIGARGTPYHDGLFFFDFQFPGDYPNSPPNVYYHSFGLRVNPNLYSSGRVCLSLLNTWNGSKCEKWNPKYSTILQVLVSIQALVLNEMPYYNEPGFMFTSKHVYNEKVFALTCKTMHHTLRTPPSSFNKFVYAHFRKRGHDILKAIISYNNGDALVGSFYESQGRGQTFCVSNSFSKDLVKLYKILFDDFLVIKAPGLNKLEPRIIVSSASGGNKGIMENLMIIVGYIWIILKKIFRVGDNKLPSSKND